MSLFGYLDRRLIAPVKIEAMLTEERTQTGCRFAVGELFTLPPTRDLPTRTTGRRRDLSIEQRAIAQQLLERGDQHGFKGLG